mgnify:FL=1
MPRKPRFTLPDIPQHVIQRGNNRSPCFRVETDYRRYLDDLHVSAAATGSLIHAYVLMTNHVHLLVTPTREHGIGQLMQALGRRYVAYFNKVHERTGTLWEGRYKASLVESDSYLLACMRYIELNPVRAGLAVTPAEYRWSSFTANALGSGDPLVTPHPLYLALADSAPRRQQTYRQLLEPAVDAQTLQRIRDALNHELALGTDAFQDAVEGQTSRKTRLGRPGRPRVGEAAADYCPEEY